MGFINLHKCLTEPKYFLRLIAIILCLCIASYQLSECVRKILHPPVSTHYTFSLNETMQYPSITLCRKPPYKTAVFEKYGLQKNGNIYQSSFWSFFDFEKYTLDQFFEEATFKFREVIPFYGFDGQLNDVEVKSFLKLRHGRCFKFTPKNYSTQWHRQKGYAIYMKHTDAVKNTNAADRAFLLDAIYKASLLNATDRNPVLDALDRASLSDATNKASLAGYHIYIHEPKDMITENNDQIGSFMEYIYVDAGEDLSYTLRTNEYNQLLSKNHICSTDHNYSHSTCTEMGLHKIITEEVGCSTPWMENENLPKCTTYDQTKQIISLYSAYSKNHKHFSTCPRSCNISIYIPYVQSRDEIELPISFLSIYYSSNLVTVMEEITGYDWNLFLADLGGSLGFLLGLSVLGIIGALEQILKLCFGIKTSTQKKPETPTIFVNGKKVDDVDDKEPDLTYYLDYYRKSNVFDNDNNIKY